MVLKDKTIKKRDFITVNYGWTSKSTSYNKYECGCGESNCTGSLFKQKRVPGRRNTKFNFEMNFEISQQGTANINWFFEFRNTTTNLIIQVGDYVEVENALAAHSPDNYVHRVLGLFKSKSANRIYFVGSYISNI